MSATRKSRKRDAILACLAGTKTHPPAEWIHAQLKGQMPDLSLGTVYRNLARFRQEGLAISVGTVMGQERFDGCTAPHAHFVCRRCGEVRDVECAIPSPPESLGAKVEGCQLSYHGLCHDCLNEISKENEGGFIS